MPVFYSCKEFSNFITTQKSKGQSIGFVPTMGALHKGHGSLIEVSLRENDLTVVSIFVNPTQFNNAADLDKYPRPFKQDVAYLEQIDPAIVVFSPEAKDLYGGSVQSKAYRFGGLEHEMEGKHRPGHFDGVGTVLNLLFRKVLPNNAYFGQKDFQQLQIVRKLVQIEKLPITIVGCPIHRAKSGLAMSSRNKRLSTQQTTEAALLFKALTHAQTAFKTKSIAQINKEIAVLFKENPHLELEYFEIAKADTLKTAIRKRKNKSYRAFLAVFAGPVRLIDNIALN
ncbi:MAG: pantoate--beta-alanine ligase [Gilvibacter sp.]